MGARASLLVADDDTQLVRSMKRLLGESYAFAGAATKAQALRVLGRRNFGGIVVDRRLPDGDGLEICRALRERGDRTPLLVLSAMGTPHDIIDGLEAGADDYVVKPANTDVLKARLAALIRRRHPMVVPLSDTLSVDMYWRQLHVAVEDGELEPDPIPLAPVELRLLLTLARRKGQIVPRNELISAIWSPDDEPSENALDAAISRLRRKMGSAGDHIETVRLVGVRLSEGDAEALAEAQAVEAKDASDPE